MRSQSSIELREREAEKRINKHQYEAKLYHYTSTASLMGIVSKKEIWLGNTANMNDRSEIINFIEKLQEAVLNDINPEGIEECKSFFEKLYDRLKCEYPFASCFSKLNDNAAQWERYADNAHGVCIVFNTSRLLNLFWYSGALLHEVFYEYDIREHKLYRILRDFFNTGDLKEFDSEKEAMDQILGCAYLHKHESFCTESEIRLSTLWKQEVTESELAFEMVNGKLKKVLKISLDNLCKEENIDFEELIDGIVIAPCSEQSELELKEYLESLRYQKISKKITKSQCPLR